ncbi:MAG: cysteine synthase family protein, partial [Candidatus Poseidoniia archaeon]|nr:cysteine synthase family protein [Candidatus Poseidoniia archaeon]
MGDGAGSGQVPASKSIHDSILTAIGDTPLVRLPTGFEPGISCEILLKIEFMNPGGSIKDRIGLFMVREAERKGLLKPGARIVECSSGNTGAGLSLVAAALGYPITIVIPDKMSQEKIDVLRAYGADVVITPANVPVDHPDHYTQKARRIAEETPGAWWPNQYHNPDNTAAHYRTTGSEIWRQCEGRLDAFVAGAGTGGTLAGVARYLKEQDPSVQVVGVDPPGSILADYWKTGELVEPGFYFVEGVGEEEVPAAWDPEVVDDYLVVKDADSFAMARRLALATG